MSPDSLAVTGTAISSTGFNLEPAEGWAAISLDKNPTNCCRFRSAVELLAALDFLELSHEAPVAAVQEVLNGLALRGKAETGAALQFGADAVVGHERTLGHAEPLTSVSPNVDTHAQWLSKHLRVGAIKDIRSRCGCLDQRAGLDRSGPGS
jgi:hypothetical protein